MYLFTVTASVHTRQSVGYTDVTTSLPNIINIDYKLNLTLEEISPFPGIQTSVNGGF